MKLTLLVSGCSGPAFNITVDDAQRRRYCWKEDIHFCSRREVNRWIRWFQLLSTEENDGRGLSLKTVIEADGGCGTCGGYPLEKGLLDNPFSMHYSKCTWRTNFRQTEKHLCLWTFNFQSLLRQYFCSCFSH